MGKYVGEHVHLLGEFTPQHAYPWFGEMALLSKRGREGTAVSIERSKLLVLERCNFTKFLHVVPTFTQMFATSVTSYTTLNKLQKSIRQMQESKEDRAKGAELDDDEEEAEGGGPHSPKGSFVKGSFRASMATQKGASGLRKADVSAALAGVKVDDDAEGMNFHKAVLSLTHDARAG